MAIERLQVILTLAASQYKKEAREAATATGRISTEAKGAATQTGGLTSRMGAFGSVLRGAAVTGGLVALGRGLGATIEQAERINSIAAITNQVIEQTGGVANVTAGHVLTMSDRLEALTGVESEVVQEGANVLLTFRNIRNEVGEGNDVFDRTTRLMLDIATVMNTDTAGAATQLGKALNDPVAGMSALSRAGLTFNESQKQQIRDLVASNDLMGAQKLILDELETQLGGTAEAAVKMSDQISNAFGRITDQVGLALLPFLDTFATELQFLTGMINEVERFSQVTGHAAGSAELLGSVLVHAAGEVGRFGRDSKTTRDALDELGPSIENLVDLWDGSIGEMQRVRDNLDNLQEAYGLTDEQVQVLADVLDNELNAALEAQADANFVARYRERVIPTLEDTGGAARDTTADLMGLADQFRSMVDPAFAALNALDKFQEKQLALNDAIDEYGVESKEAEEAGRDVLDSYGDLLAAAQEYADVSGQDLIASIVELGEKAGVPAGVIASIVEALNQLDGFVATATVNVRERVTRFGFLEPTAGSRVRHTGGPGMAGVPYKIRPDEEIFVPSGNGMFLLNDKVEAMLRGMSAGVTTSTHNYTIPIQSSGHPQTDAQLVGAVASVLRRMEGL